MSRMTRRLAMPYSVRSRDRAPAVHEPLPIDDSLPRACVIGAGSSGLAATKSLAAAGIPVDCFEQGTAIGGNWLMDNPNGVSACYETLEINTSCPRMAFSDFPMPADYPDYARHDQVAAYFEQYVDHFGFRDRIRFETTVEDVSPAADGTWDVRVRDREGTRVERFDAVLVANGHHWSPRLPEPAYPGEFAGEQIHSHQYRSGDQLEDRDVVVVGAGNSAMDIAVEASLRARSSHLSIRRGQWVLAKHLLGFATDRIALPGWAPWWMIAARLRIAALTSGSLSKYGLPTPAHRPGQSHPVQSDRIRERIAAGAVEVHGGIDHLEEREVVFADGTRAPADLIVWATGYRVSFPFLSPEIVDPQDNELPLFKRAVHPDHPGLFFIGLLQPVGAVMPLAEAQSQWIADILRGRCALPEPEEMRRVMMREHERSASHFYRSSRHTMEVDFDQFLWNLSRERHRGEQRMLGTPGTAGSQAGSTPPARDAHERTAA